MNGRWERVYGSITTDPGLLGALVLRLEVEHEGRKYGVCEVISDRKRRNRPDAVQMHLESMVYDLEHEIAQAGRS